MKKGVVNKYKWTVMRNLKTETLWTRIGGELKIMDSVSDSIL